MDPVHITRDTRKGSIAVTASADRRSSLNVAAAAFTVLGTGPAALAIHGGELSPQLPQQPIPVTKLRDLLLDRATSGQARDDAWREIVTRARMSGPSWVIAAVGIAWPGLRRVADRLACGYPGDLADLDDEVLTGFLNGLRWVDIRQPRIALRLWWSAYHAGERFKNAESTYSNAARVPLSNNDHKDPTDNGDGEYRDDGAITSDEYGPGGDAGDAALGDLPSQSVTASGGTTDDVAAGARAAAAALPPQRPWGHPDLVLARAVADQIVTATEARLIGGTRLEQIPLHVVARKLGIEFQAAKWRRRRAEQRLATAIHRGDLSIPTLPASP